MNKVAETLERLDTRCSRQHGDKNEDATHVGGVLAIAWGFEEIRSLGRAKCEVSVQQVHTEVRRT